MIRRPVPPTDALSLDKMKIPPLRKSFVHLPPLSCFRYFINHDSFVIL